MNYSDYRFTLDVQIHQAQVSIPVTFNDTARRLYIGFTDGRKPYTIPDGCRAVFAALKPDGKSILNDCIIENNKTVVYEFSQNTTNAEGVVDCEIRLYDCEGKELTSPQFIIVVDKKVVRDEEIPLSKSESTTLDSIIRSELERVEAEKERQKLADFLATSGGVIVSEEEPDEGLANVWVDSSPDTDEIFLLDSTDIAQELSNEENKIPSVALLKRVADDLGNGADGKDGEDGEDGFSPTATVEQTDNGAKITITDKNGTTTATVTNGANGANGVNGVDGVDGKTPYIKDGYWWIGDTNTAVKAEGTDGENGITPQVYINESTNVWEISYDGGRTWISLGVKATGDKGDTGEQGPQGVQGIQGIQGEKGDKGDTYILTDADKTEIAKEAGESIRQSLVNEGVEDFEAQMFQKGASQKTFTKKIGIITAGQSNTSGRVPVADLPSYISLPMSKCNYLSNDVANWQDGIFHKTGGDLIINVGNIADFTHRNYWSADSSNNATQKVGGNEFYARTELLDVKPNDTVILKNWGYNQVNKGQAFTGYDANGVAYANPTYKITFDEGIYNETDNTYTFVIPANCYKIGVFINVNNGDDTSGNWAAYYPDASFTVKGEGDGTLTGELTEDMLHYSSTSASRAWAFDLVTYHYLTQIANQEIYVMKWAQGGTSIDPTGEGGTNTGDNYHWTAFYEELPSMDKSLLWQFESLIRACINANKEEFEIRAMLWHQGEGDRGTKSQEAADNYYKNLKCVIAYCRGIVGNSRLPFIFGTVPTNSGQYDETVHNAMQRIAEEDNNVYLVELGNTSFLPNDDAHFNADWCEYFGKCAYNYLIDAGVINASKLNVTEPA